MYKFRKFFSLTLKGFSFIEAIVSISIIGMIIAMTLPTYRSVRDKNSFNSATSLAVKNIRYAQSLSQSNRGDDEWGVKFLSDKIIIFRGSNYDNRDSNFDEIVGVPEGVNFSGNTEIVFSKFFGIPQNTGNLNISSGSKSGSISINELGVVDY